MKRVLFLWARYSGYMAACWKQLAAISGADIRVLAIASSPNDPSDPAFRPELLRDLNVQLISERDANDYSRLNRHLPGFDADLVVMSGWQFPGYVDAVRRGHFGDRPLIVCSDNPIRHDWRQHIGSLKIRWLLKRSSLVMVPGDRGYQLMKYWRLPDRKISKGLYGVDETCFQPSIRRRNELAWPKNFVFTGRYCRRKGVDLMLEAYHHYRLRHSNPWGLVCCGRGELRSSITTAFGVTDRGFVQPHELTDVFAAASAFVLASRSDAWPLSLVEAAMAGLPILCTAACGSSAELVRDHFNGRVVATGESTELSEAMSWIHNNEENLAEFGIRSAAFGRAYSASEWALRWSAAIDRLCGSNT